jgi:hypothetical protein
MEGEDDAMTVVDGVTFGIALLGAVLGILNTWQSIEASRMKLKVVPGHLIPVGVLAEPKVDFYIEVTNLSAFPVTIKEVGILYSGTDKRGAFISPVLPDGGPWPRRLEPRTSVSIFGRAPDRTAPGGHPIRCAYADTECGIRKRGTSPALKQIAGEQVSTS